MRSEEFLAGMKNVDADLIEEAAPKSTGVSGKIARGVLKGVAAAALCAVVAGGVFLASRKYVAPPSAGTDAESTDSETGLAAMSGSEEVTEAARNGAAVDSLDDLIKAVSSEKGMALKDFFRLVSPLYDHVTLESLSIENRKIIPPYNPSLNSNRPEIKTPISIMATSFYCNNSCCSVYSICDNGMPPFELPKEYIIDSLSGNAKPLQYDINDPVIQNSRVVAVRIYSTAYNRDFASCASQSIVSGKREPLSLEEAARTDKSEQLLLSDLILPENMEFIGSIEPRNRQTGDRYYNNGESWGCVIGTCADDGSNYDALMKTYNDLGSPVMTYALYTDTDINDPYKYDKRYAVTVMIPDSALEYVIRNLNSNKLQCDGEFVRELLKQTGTDLPVLSVSEILTDPYLFYDEDEMFAALNRPFMGYNAATGSAD